jgi:electron transport complex protein RnfE
MTPAQAPSASRASRAFLVCIAPALVMAETLGQGLVLGLTAVLVAGTTRLLARSGRAAQSPEGELAVLLLVAAGCAALVQVVLRAWWPEVHRTLGASVGLVLAVVALAGATQTRGPDPGPIGVLAAAFLLVALAALRAMLGRGAFPGAAPGDASGGFTLLVTPAGAFILLGIALALGNAWAARRRMAT